MLSRDAYNNNNPDLGRTLFPPRCCPLCTIYVNYIALVSINVYTSREVPV